MSEELSELLKRAELVVVSPEQKERQRRSFAFGNTHFENKDITRDTVAQAAAELAATKDQNR